MKKILILSALLSILRVASAQAVTPPTLVSYGESAWNTSGTSKTVTGVTWQTGDVIVAIAGTEDASTANVIPNVPTAAGLTFTSQQVTTTGSTCAARVSTAVAASSGTSTVTDTMTSGTPHWGFGVWVFRGSDGVGNSTLQATSSLSTSLTSAAADSAVVWAVFDFNVGALQTIVPTPTDTRQRVVDTGRYTLYVADLTDQPSTGAVSYGLSGSGTGPFSIVALEVKGAAAGGGGSPAKRLSLLGVGGL